MPYFSDKEIEKAREMDLLTYLKYCEPSELVHFSGKTFTTRTHDSLKISNGKWMWWSQGIGGKSALDYLIKVQGYSFTDAVARIIGQKVEMPSDFSYEKKAKPKRLLLPKKNSNNENVIGYLNSRGIDKQIINYCIEEELIYESSGTHHVIFIGFDSNNIARYASFRATSESRLMGDVSGSTKCWSFRLTGAASDLVHIFESAIDLMSYATLLKQHGQDFRDYNLLSLAGIYMPRKDIKSSKVPSALEQYLNENKRIKRITVHFDNDKAGRLAARTINEIMKDRYEVKDEPPPYGKDYNEYLCFERRKK